MPMDYHRTKWVQIIIFKFKCNSASISQRFGKQLWNGIRSPIARPKQLERSLKIIVKVFTLLNIFVCEYFSFFEKSEKCEGKTADDVIIHVHQISVYIYVTYDCYQNVENTSVRALHTWIIMLLYYKCTLNGVKWIIEYVLTTNWLRVFYYILCEIKWKHKSGF